MSLSFTTAPYFLGIVRLPILLSSQLWFSRSSTKHEAVRLPSVYPPQVATSGVGSEVMKVLWPLLAEGRGGGEHPLTLGNSSTVDVVGHPPVISKMLSWSNVGGDVGDWVGSFGSQ